MIRRLFVPDCHFPDVDYAAYAAMLNAAIDFRPHEIVILGDFFDMYPVSQYRKNPSRMVTALEDDLQTGIAALHKMFTLLKPRKIYFIVGNHEFRLERYIDESAPLVKKLFPPLEELFQLPKKTIMVPYPKFLHFDGLAVCHGIDCGDTCCIKMLKRLGKSVLFGHTHKLQSASITNLNGTISAYSCGWLGDIDAIDYSSFPNYQHGFSTGHFAKSGRWNVQLHAVDSGNTMVLDEEYARRRTPACR